MGRYFTLVIVNKYLRLSYFNYFTQSDVFHQSCYRPYGVPEVVTRDNVARIVLRTVCHHGRLRGRRREGKVRENPTPAHVSRRKETTDHDREPVEEFF